MNHPELRGRCKIGYDYLKQSSTVTEDLAGHGTAVSGLIVAQANNGIGIAGVAGTASVKVVSYRVGGNSSTDRLLNGAYITAALEEIAQRSDIQVVNMSFGSDESSVTREAAIQKLRNAGKILVASAGNDGDTGYSYPASSDGVISVGATTINNEIADFSNRNSKVDICAPGKSVCTTTADGEYRYASGTSFSSPIVAGAAAVIKCAGTGLSPEQEMHFVIKDSSFVASNFTVSPLIHKDEAGDPVTLSATGTGGSREYQYKFTATLNGKEEVLQDYTSENEIQWTPIETGIYTFTSYVKDSLGTVGSASEEFEVTTAIPIITTFEPTYTSPCPVGGSSFIHVSGYRGIGELKFKVTVTRNGVTTVLKDYDDKGGAWWTPMECGIYTLKLYARDEVGTTVTEQMDYEVILPFKDVRDGDWYRDYVEYVYARQIMTGLEYSLFGPNESLARAQFALILYRMNDSPKVEYSAKFPDVGDGIWYTDAILWANSIGVVTGYSNTGYFGPGDNINREQMAVMMYRYAKYKGYDVSQKANFSQFIDASKVSGFAKEAMQWAVGNKIINGKNKGTMIDPQGNASRAECATIIMRFIENYGK